MYDLPAQSPPAPRWLKPRVPINQPMLTAFHEFNVPLPQHIPDKTGSMLNSPDESSLGPITYPWTPVPCKGCFAAILALQPSLVLTNPAGVRLLFFRLLDRSAWSEHVILLHLLHLGSYILKMSITPGVRYYTPGVISTMCDLTTSIVVEDV